MGVPPSQIAQQTPPKLRGVQTQSVSQEPTKGWWSANGAWGNRFQGPLPDAPGQLVPIMSLDHTPGPPRPIAIQLLRNDRSTTDFTNVNSEVYARITYGAGGVTNTFDVDYANGCSFSVVANMVRVDAITYLPVSGTAYVPVPNVILGATIGLGSPGACLCPTLTIPSVQLQNGDSQDIVVPDFAKKVSWIYGNRLGPAAANFDFSLRSNGGQVLWAADNLEARVLEHSPLVLPGNTAVVRLENNASGGIRVYTVFQLGI